MITVINNISKKNMNKEKRLDATPDLAFMTSGLN